MSSDFFYESLPAFTEFSGVADVASYKSVPDDWHVLAADIVDSRKAIAAGHYKNVNMIGAAVIAAVLNTLGRENTPFVFGGDGALLLVPASRVREGREALARVCTLARAAANMTLRAAAIPVSHLRSEGTDIRLRKLELTKGNYLAMAVGDGLALAEEILKTPERAGPFVIEPAAQTEAPLEGLSCRWDTLPAQRGRIASLIVKPSSPDLLPRCLAHVASAVGEEVLSEEDSGQIAIGKRMRFRFPPRSLGFEVGLKRRAGEGAGYVMLALFESLVILWGRLTGMRVGPLVPERYMAELSRNTDHRKLDDSLRMVLDLSEDALVRLTAGLEAAAESGELTYGLHVSDAAIMTCFVSDIGAGQHIHFIDGADGGFAMAAEDMKHRSVKQPASQPT